MLLDDRCDACDQDTVYRTYSSRSSVVSYVVHVLQSYTVYHYADRYVPYVLSYRGAGMMDNSTCCTAIDAMANQQQQHNLRASLDHLLQVDAFISLVFGVAALIAPHMVVSRVAGGYHHATHETLRCVFKIAKLAPFCTKK